MAIYHLNAKVFGRNDGISIIARAAYRSGSKMRDPETGKKYDYRRKKEVVYSEISLCKNAPLEYRDRKKLWTSVQKVEKTANSQYAREIEVAIPKEYTREQQIDVLHEYIHKNFTEQGMVCDWSIHNKDGNPHCHMLLTVRPIKEDGSWGHKMVSKYKADCNTGERIPIIDPKTGCQKKDKRNRLQWEREIIPSTDWNTTEAFHRWRESWAEINNRELEKLSLNLISEKSNADRGIEAEPTIHEGYVARKIEQLGGISDRCETNRQIRRKNAILEGIRTRLTVIQKEISKLVQERKRTLKALLSLIDDDPDVGKEINR